MPIFNFTRLNLNTLAEQIIPTSLRRPVLMALLQEMLAPLHRINHSLNTFIAIKRQRWDYNGQVRLLEHIINHLMISHYSLDNPVIYLAEPTPIEEFLITPDRRWYKQQNSIFPNYDIEMMNQWNTLNPTLTLNEHPEGYAILHDQGSVSEGLGFEVHLTPQLAHEAPSTFYKQKFYANGGVETLKAIVDTYKIAGKQYVIIQD